MAKNMALTLGLAWLTALIIVQTVLIKYEATPALASKLPATWPANVSVAPATAGATLMLLVHPQCPCTRATFTELESILARAKGRVAVQMLFFKPKQAPANWVKTGLWLRAKSLPHVTAIVDEDGQLAKRFWMHTSGEVALFNPAGKLLFQGGITTSRGHEGDNAGERAVIQLATTGRGSMTHTPVFGCEVWPVSAEGNLSVKAPAQLATRS
jgi:hypothetical protein